jgi:hypothetical protein
LLQDPDSGLKHPKHLPTGRCSGPHTDHCNKADGSMRDCGIVEPQSSSAGRALAVGVVALGESSRVCQMISNQR